MRKEESNQTQHITPHITHHSGSGIILTISSMLYQNIILLLAFGFIATSIIEKPCLHKGCKLAGGLTLKQYKTLKASHRELKVKNKYNRKPLITVLQWNILYDRVQNSIDSWVFRKPHVCNYINQLKPDVRIKDFFLFLFASCTFSFKPHNINWFRNNSFFWIVS